MVSEVKQPLHMTWKKIDTQKWPFKESDWISVQFHSQTKVDIYGLSMTGQLFNNKSVFEENMVV